AVPLEEVSSQAQYAVEGLLKTATASVRKKVLDRGKLSAAKIEVEQRAVHGLAWLATYVGAIREMLAYARRMREQSRFGRTEELLTQIGLGEYLAQIFGGIPMNQGEIVRLADFGLSDSEIAPFRTHTAVEALLQTGNTVENRKALATEIGKLPEGPVGDP